MNLEIYTPGRTAEFEVPEVAAPDGRRKLCEALGLGGQLERSRQDVRRELCRLAGFEPLSREALAIWTNFLPERYTSKYGWKDYRYDSIPDDVLALMARCERSELFDRLEIRTPERIVHSDPALFGVIDEDYYLLARWAESEFVSPREMVAQARRNAHGFVVPIGWTLGGLALVCSASAFFGDPGPQGAYIIASIGAVFVGAGYLARRFIRPSPWNIRRPPA